MKKFLIFLIGFFLIFPILLNPNTQANFNDPYYIADFVEYDIGDKWINQTDNGLNWLDIIPDSGTYPKIDYVHKCNYGDCVPYQTKGYEFAKGNNDGNAWFNMTSYSV